MENFEEYLKFVNNCDPDDQLLSQTRLGQQLGSIPLNQIKGNDLRNLTQPLNVEQLIPTENGLARDYRGLAELMGFSLVELESIFKRLHNPTQGLIECYMTESLTSQPSKTITVRCLLKLIETLERFDIIDDCIPMFITLANQNQSNLYQIQDSLLCKDINRASHQIDLKELEKLTIDDTSNIPVIYDAFICYAPGDMHYAQELANLLLSRGKKIATANDLLPGRFENDALMRLIDDRCRKVIIILTPNFLKSKECEFQTKFASEIGIKDGSPKIIPVLYEACELDNLPRMIQVLSKIDMTNQQMRYEWQLNKLLASLTHSDNSSISAGDAERFIPTIRISSNDSRQFIPSDNNNMIMGGSLITHLLPGRSSSRSSQVDLTSNATSGEPLVELMLSESPAHALSNITHQGRQVSPSGSQSSVASSSLNWLKSVKKRMLGSSMNTLESSSNHITSSRAHLISSSSQDLFLSDDKS